MAQHYQLHGLRIRTVSDRSTAERVLHRTLRYKGAEVISTPDGVDVTLDFSADRDAASLPEDGHHVDLSEVFGIDIWRTSNRMILRREKVTVELDPEAGLAKAAIAADLLTEDANRRKRSLLSYLAALSLAILLRSRGWFPLHAAGLVHNGRGALLTARSGSGKSTAALSLVRNGWEYLSDDTVLLRADGEGVKAYSFRRDFCVEPGIAAHFPELNGPEWPPALSNPAKWQVDPGQIYPGQFAASCTPRVLILLNLADAKESRVEPVDTKPVLEQLISQGSFFLAPDSEVATRHLATLRQLIDQSRNYRLHAARDALDEPRTIHALLAPLLEGAPIP